METGLKAAGKTQGPSQVLEFMGILLDTVKMQARLPPDKIGKLHAINFACEVVPPGRPFLQRMIALTRNVSKHHHITYTYIHISFSSLPLGLFSGRLHQVLCLLFNLN